ncbi:MAG: type II toxin-antitoxin system VapC family toxin [Actinobacteria bacterium]|nr:type II toxin-antitoxin system VapC family toxin [Actinomycetota bacterium]
MIVVDTTVLVYAVGADHRLAEPCRRIVDDIAHGRVTATTTAEVIQEFVHVRARRRGRADAVALGEAFATLFAPLLVVDEAMLRRGLALYGDHESLGAFDAVLVAAAMATGAEALVSADRAFARVAGLRHIDPTDWATRASNG